MSKVRGRTVKHVKIPLFAVRTVATLALPFTGFVRYVYWSLKLLNNFPEDLSSKVPEDHQILMDTFDYQPVTFAEEILKRNGNKIKD